MKIFGILALLSISLFSSSIPEDTKQLIVVTTDSWSTPNATLDRYQKDDKGWRRVGKRLQVVVGKNGLGWGIGLHHIPPRAKYIKREGDGKAPAGIFELVNGFGYQPFKIAYPYSVYSEHHHCVDDSHSIWYNKIIDSKMVKKDYRSYEKMKFPKEYYKYGIVVDHNPKALANAGSCIFMHIKKPNHIPTVGCTAMSENEIKQILRWLDPHKHPLLVQAPKSEMRSLLPLAIESK